MNLETELLEITSENLSEAQFMASNFIDLSVQHRVFFNVIGSESVISYLRKLGIDIEEAANIHSIKRVVEKIDIADIFLDNIHIDVRVVFNENEIFIPKSHYEFGIVPDIYAVLKFDNSYQRINLIGFFEPSEINLNNSNDEYYFIERKKLHSPFDMLDFIKRFNGDTNKNLSDGQILRGRELSVAVADHDVTEEEFKEFIGLLAKSKALRSSVLEYDNFETLASKVARALQVSKSKNVTNNEVVDINDFMNINDELKQEDTPDKQDNEDNNEDNNKVQEPQDLNGDSMLDEVSDAVLNTADIAADAATIAGSAIAANALGSQGVSKEAMDLAGVAGDVMVDAAEEMINDESDKHDSQKPADETANEPADVPEDEPADETADEPEDKSLPEDFETQELKEEEEELDFSDFEQDMDFETFEDFITEEPIGETKSEQESEKTTDDTDSDIEDNSNEDSNNFDIGDSLDTEDLSDSMEESADIDYDLEDIDKGSVEEILEDVDVVEDQSEIDTPSESTSVTTDIPAEANDEPAEENETKDEVPVETFDSYETNTLEIDNDIELLENDVENPFNPDAEEPDKDDEFELSEDEQLPDVTKPEPEAGDDDLILPPDEADNNEDIIQETPESEVKLEDISSADIGMEPPILVPPEGAASEADNFDNALSFEELPSEKAEEFEKEDDYNLVNFSDLTDVPTPEPYNAEVNFTDVEDFESFETIAPIDENSNADYFAETIGMDDLIKSNSARENSVVITDKNSVPGEIFIDINKDSSNVGISTNEHLEELYNKNSNVLSEDDELNESINITSEKSKTVPLALGIGGIALVVVLAGIIIMSVSRFMNPTQNESEPVITDNIPQNNNLGDDVPNMNVDNNGVIMKNNQEQSSVPQASEDIQNNSGQVKQNTKPIPATSFLSVRKLSWEVPDYVSSDINFRQYFQSAGKSLKAALTSDLLLASDYTYSDQIRVSILYSNDGTFQRAKILLSSGSSQVDNIVLQSVNQTLRVLKAPNSLGNDQSTTVILKIYL